MAFLLVINHFEIQNLHCGQSKLTDKFSVKLLAVPIFQQLCVIMDRVVGNSLIALLTVVLPYDLR